MFKFWSVHGITNTFQNSNLFFQRLTGFWKNILYASRREKACLQGFGPSK